MAEGDGQSMKVGRLRIVTRAGLRGPGGQEAKERGTRRSSPKGEKRYLAVCDSNNESKPPGEVRSADVLSWQC